jgi:hypothetical protein
LYDLIKKINRNTLIAKNLALIIKVTFHFSNSCGSFFGLITLDTFSHCINREEETYFVGGQEVIWNLGLDPVSVVQMQEGPMLHFIP